MRCRSIPKPKFMETTYSEQQITYLSDFHVTVRTAVADLIHKMNQEATAIENAGSCTSCEDNYARLARHCEHVLHWCSAYSSFSGLDLAQEDLDWDALQPSEPPASDDERDCAIRDFKRLIAIAEDVLDEILWLQTYFNCPDGAIPVRTVRHWFPDRFGAPEVRYDTLYESIDIQERVVGWEKLDPECDALLEQYSALWQRIHAVSKVTKPLPDRTDAP